MALKKIIVISGANLYSGGTLSIMQDCLNYLDETIANNYRVVALVHDLKDFAGLKNIELLEIIEMRKSYFHRLYFEYYKYKKLSKELNPFLWFSLNDMSSNVNALHRAVYCHNPSPFRKITFKDIFDQPQLFFFSLFYKYLYKINIAENDYIVVQQNWIKEQFTGFFNLKSEKIIVARPNEGIATHIGVKNKSQNEVLFFYPALSRPFKNFEVIIKAVKLLKERECVNFKVILTINECDNNYAKRMVSFAKGLVSIQFTGFLSRDKVADYYNQASCLLFPSKLETWGLPISEFKIFNKPIFLSDLPYAKETLGKYEKAVFFEPDNEVQLAELMFKIINMEKIKFSKTKETNYTEPFAQNWEELFNLLLA
jgi:glycosyltransferase involved in cell wall biosynthesis